MSDGKKNCSAEKKLKSQNNSVEENAENHQPNDIKRDATSHDELNVDALASEMSDLMVGRDSIPGNNATKELSTIQENIIKTIELLKSSNETAGTDVSTTIENSTAEVGEEEALDKDLLGSDRDDSDSEFGADIPDEWSSYKQYFEQCLKKLEMRTDDMKKKPYDELCKMLVQPTTLYRERKRFYLAKKRRNESNEEYVKRLTDLSSTCQFGERQNLTIADKFIADSLNLQYYSSGYSAKLSPWMELQQEVDCEKALEIAKTEKDFKRQMMNYFYFGDPIEKENSKVPPHLANRIRNEIMETNLAVEWDDIAGLDFAKSVIKESIVWPMLRPDIFTGLRKLPKAMLLFGPPGTGKTMIAKCIAAQSRATFFYVSASTMASKWHGESEQLVRALFTVAAEHQPSVIFFDEVDSLLTQRKDADHEVSRRVKTEFMIQLDGAATKDDTRVLFIGATNRPQDLDEAARRRFVKRVYVPLPDLAARQQLLRTLLKTHHSNVTDADIKEIAASMTNEFSGADIKWLCQDAAMEPLRSVGDRIKDIDVKDIRPLEMNDFVESAKRVRPSVASADLTAMAEWDRLYGSNSERADFIDNNHMYS